MTQKKPLAMLIVMALLVTTLFGAVPSVRAAGVETTEEAYISELQIEGTPQASYTKGDEITLKLSVRPRAGGDFGLRLYDNTVTFDTNKLTLKSVTASAATVDHMSLNQSYHKTESGDLQKIKWLYAKDTARMTDISGQLELGTIVLTVNSTISAGLTEIVQTGVGMADANGRQVQNITAESMTVTLDDQLPDYHFGMRISGGQKSSYQTGDQITVTSYITSSSVNFRMAGASTTVTYDDSVFAATAGAPVGNVIQQVNAGNIKMVYNPAAESSHSGEFILGSYTLTVKDTAETGVSPLTQEQAKINVSGTVKQGDASGISLRIGKAGSCTFTLTPQSGAMEYKPGERVILEIGVAAAEAFEPRMIQEEITFSTSSFRLITATAISENTAASGKPGVARWVYSDTGAAGSTGAVNSLKLGSLELEVLPEAAPGTAYINQNEANLVAKEGQGVLLYEDVTAPTLPIVIAAGEKPSYQLTVKASESIMGTVGGGGSFKAGQMANLTATANSGYKFIGWTSNNGGVFGNQALAVTSFLMPVGDTTVTANFAVMSDPAVAPGSVEYDKYFTDSPVVFTIDEGDYPFGGIEEKGEPLSGSADYRLSGGAVTFSESYLKQLSTGLHSLTFLFGESDEKSIEVTLNITDGTPEPPVKMYRLLATANYGSMGKVTGSGSYEPGSPVAIMAMPNSGYKFVGWEVKDGFGSVAEASSMSTTFTMPSGNAMVTAVFASDSKRIYNASLMAEGVTTTALKPGDSLSLNVQLSAADGSPYRIRLLEEAVAIDRRLFEITSLNGASGAYLTTHAGIGEEVGKEIVRLFYSSQSEDTMSGILSLGTIGLKVKDTATEGTVSLSSVVTGLSDGDELDTTTNVSATALELTIEREAVKYALNLAVNDPAMGSITKGTSGSYTAGTTVELEAAANAGYKFVKWESGNGGFTSSDALQTRFTMPAGATTVMAVFADMSDPIVTPGKADYDKYTSTQPAVFTIDGGDYGFGGIREGEMVLVQGVDYLLSGSTVTFPETFWKGLSLGDHTLTFLFGKTGEKTVHVILTIIDTTPEPPTRKYILAAEPNFASMGTVTGGGSYEAGVTVTLAAAAKEGYRFVRWDAPEEAGIEDTDAVTTSLTMPSRDIRITAIFVSANARAYEALLAVENEKQVYRPGERFTVKVQAKAKDDQPYGIRMLETNVKIDTTIFELIDAVGIDGTIVTAAAIEGGEKNVRIYYYNGNAEESSTEPTSLAELILMVNENATPGRVSLTQSVMGFVDAKGDDLTNNVIADEKSLVIEEKTESGFTVRGSVTLTADKIDITNATVVLTRQLLASAKDSYGYEATAEDYLAEVSEDGSYELTGVEKGEYTLLIRRPGALYYQKNQFVIVEESVNTSDGAVRYKTVTLAVGELTGDGRINMNDILIVTNKENYNQKADAEGAVAAADLTGDGRINMNDILIITNGMNYNQRALVE